MESTRVHAPCSIRWPTNSGFSSFYDYVCEAEGRAETEGTAAGARRLRRCCSASLKLKLRLKIKDMICRGAL
eukprot:6180442-Pleurochrysis_carterae.AAC.2